MPLLTKMFLFLHEDVCSRLGLLELPYCVDSNESIHNLQFYGEIRNILLYTPFLAGDRLFNLSFVNIFIYRLHQATCI